MIDYEWFKRNHICPYCGDKARKDRVTCISCGERMAVYQMIQRAKMTPEQKKERQDKEIERRRKVRQERKAAGLCIDCGRPATGHIRCSRCLAKARIADRRRMICK